MLYKRSMEKNKRYQMKDINRILENDEIKMVKEKSLRNRLNNKKSKESNSNKNMKKNGRCLM